MYSLVYFTIVFVLLILLYITVNTLTLYIFNKGKKEFQLKAPSPYRLADNYTYGGDALDTLTDGSLNCSTGETDELIECDIDASNELGRHARCAQCRQISSRCLHIGEPVYSASDPSVVVIAPNSSPDKGYCLPSVTAARSCTRRHGGKWILSRAEKASEADRFFVYTFECYCATPRFFQNDVLAGNDCTKFVGCHNGALRPGWSSYEQMECDCPAEAYEQQPGSANEPPSCLPVNVYRRRYDEHVSAPFDILAREFVEPDYLALLDGAEISLPDPCTFDLTTKTFVKGIGRAVWDSSRRIAYCESLHSNYRPMIMNDDYLRGNGGKYANVMFRFRIGDASSERNDDADDHYNDYRNGVMYEVHRTGASLQHVAGVRVPYSNFPVRLPYLESDSYNMGNEAGHHYSVHPVIPLNRRPYAMVYIFDVNRPDYKLELVLGNAIQYIPAFMSTSVDTRYRVYNGAIACVNVANAGRTAYLKRAFRIIYPTPPGHKFAEKLGTTGLMGELVYPNVSSDKFTAGYGFHFVHDGQVEPHTELFTGTIFTYTIDRRIYTRPVSCGLQLLTNKYRRNYDPEWRNRPQEDMVGLPLDSMPQLAVAERDAHMFTRNSYDIERNDVGVVKRAVARYDVSKARLRFPTFYS